MTRFLAADHPCGVAPTTAIRALCHLRWLLWRFRHPAGLSGRGGPITAVYGEIFGCQKKVQQISENPCCLIPSVA